MRIVTLLPSATDMVVALGASADLVGVSHSCGANWSHLPALTSTIVDTSASAAAIDAQVKQAAAPLYHLDIKLLEVLAPDVIVSQSLCDVCAVASGDVEAAVAGLSSRPLLVNLAPFRLDDVPQGFVDIGEAIGRPTETAALADRWATSLAQYRQVASKRLNRPRIAFLDWIDPSFAAGHWIPDMLDLLGCESVLAQPGEPSHEVDWDRVRTAAPDAIFAASCGQTAGRAEADTIPADLTVTLLDGYEHFSRPSPALLESFAVLEQALHAKGL